MNRIGPIIPGVHKGNGYEKYFWVVVQMDDGRMNGQAATHRNTLRLNTFVWNVFAVNDSQY